MTPTISSEVIALVDAGHGVAEVYDPATNRRFLVKEMLRPMPPCVPESDEELRGMLDEARKDFDEGKVVHRTTEEFLAEARRRAGLG